MRRLVLASFAALSLVAGGAGGRAAAQFVTPPPATGPFDRPAVYPYLNLTPPGSPAVNSLGPVGPQHLGSHVAGFQNHGAFFQNWRTAGALAGAAPPAGGPGGYLNAGGPGIGAGNRIVGAAAPQGGQGPKPPTDRGNPLPPR